MARNFKKIHASDQDQLARVLNTVQSNVQEALSDLQNSKISNGVLLQSLSLIAGNNVIRHKLGRKAFGFIIVSSSAVSNFSDDLITAGTAEYFTLNSSAALTVNIWVF
jgi:hypothetical protein